MLTREEALDVANRLDIWPPGLGFALVRAPAHPRGWIRAPGYRPFEPPPPNTLHCPVVLVHEARRTETDRKYNYYTGHLKSFYDLRDAVARTKGITAEQAHTLYNHLLKTDPRELAGIYREYAIRSDDQ